MGRGRRPRILAASTNSDSDEQEEEEGMETNEVGASLPESEPNDDEAEVDTSDPVIAGLRASMDNILQLVTDILPTCSDDDKKKEEVLNRMKSSMLRLVRSEMNYLEGLKIVERIKKEMPKIGNDADDHVILSHCEQLKTVSLEKISEHRNNLKENVLKKHLNYARLLKETQDTQRKIDFQNARKGHGDSDFESQPETSYADLEDDDTKTVEMVPTVDPITKHPLTDPIRNRHCRHIYGKASILAMLKNHRKTRCPTLGCPNRKYVIASDLVEDPELTIKVQKKLKDTQKTHANRKQMEQNTID